jgi:hypothetical protein
MGHYKSNLRDIEFNLFEVLDLDDYLGKPPFGDVDHDAVLDALREVERLSREDFAASFEEADRNPPTLRDGEVVLPDAVKKSLDAYFEGGWHLLGAPEELGGFGAPGLVRWATQEMLVGANPAVFFYVSGILMAVVLGLVGTPEQVERFAKPMIDRRWGGTMVLTEPDAGSDVGAGTTKAIHVEGETYHLEGVKRFITSGDHDYAENIVHLVLARREGGEPGTPGLSMFIVPKYLVNEDGSLGERNGVVATNVEKKMGIKGSSTCELTFGAGRPAVGYLVGGVHTGIRQMFRVIEDARLLIGCKSAATLSTGYLNALEYAKHRVQSADLTQMPDKSAPRVEIIRHPDVRRMLMLLKSHSEGMRALLYYTAWASDQERMHPEDESFMRHADLLLPLLKGYGSEKSYELLGQALQVFGGSGFLQDYPLEQYIRDVKIDSLYEGTTGIQALDLFFRKIVRDHGETLRGITAEVMEIVDDGPEALQSERLLLGEAVEHAQAHIGVMVGHAIASQSDAPELYKVGLHANALLETLAEIVIAWLMLRHAAVALRSIDGASASDASFYRGKVESARFFAHHALPKARLRREAAEREDGALMEMPDAAF